MAKYRLLTAAVIDGALIDAGTEIEFDGVPGRHMEPLDKAAKDAVKEMPGPAPLDPEYLAYRHDRSIPGDPGIFTGFSGFGALASPLNVDVPYVSGDGTVGSTLECTMGNWEGEPTEYGYLWYSDERDTGVTESSYLVDATDAGATVTCVVTATNMWGSTTAPPSNGVEISAASGTRRTGGGRG